MKRSRRAQIRFLAAITIAGIGWSAFAAPTPKPKTPEIPWTEHARRFTGESMLVRENAIEALRKRPDLKGELKRAIGTHHHFLALDVISVLRLRTMFQELIFFSEKDRTGYSYHVLNSLMNPGEEAEIGAIYLVRLDREKVSAASKMAILDSLSRMNVSVGVERLERMLRHAEPEVRSAALAYLRTELLHRKNDTYRGLLRIGIADSAFQNRLQTLFLISELNRGAAGPGLNVLLGSCIEDSVAQVRSFCNELRARTI